MRSQHKSLLVIHLLFWLIYLIADSFDHIKNGYYDLMPSLFCAISACIMTGVTALIFLKLEKKELTTQLSVFFFCGYIAAVIWHKFFEILHRLSETSVIEEIELLFGKPILGWIETGYMPLFLFLAWGGIFVGAKWYFANNEHHQQLQQAIVEAKNAQLQALRYQINPHFLFNVLNSIDVSILKDDKDTAHNMVKHLSHFLRKNLQRGEQSKITVKQELEIIEDYIAIEETRFKDKLTINKTINTDCWQLMLPPMLMQPLIENAIKFAWHQQDKGSISICIARVADKLSIEVINSKPKTSVNVQGTGKGLENIQTRLALCYGEDARLITKESSQEFNANIVLPLEQYL